MNYDKKLIILILIFLVFLTVLILIDPLNKIPNNKIKSKDYQKGYNDAVINIVNELQFCKPVNISVDNIYFQVIAMPCIVTQP